MALIADNLVYVVILVAVGYFAYRYMKYGSLSGSLYGSKVDRTIGNIDLKVAGRTSQSIRVHVLENKKIAVEESNKAPFGASMHGFVLTSDQTEELVKLLKDAIE